MKMVKSLLLGSAAGIVAVAGAQAADLPVKAKPVEYVKICSLYGDGFYYMPGTEGCLKLEGTVRAQYGWNNTGARTPHYTGTGGAQDRSTNPFSMVHRGQFATDARWQTAYGSLRMYSLFRVENENNGSILANGAGITSTAGGGPAVNIPRAFIQWAGFTFGHVKSLGDTSYLGEDGMQVLHQTQNIGSESGSNGNNELAYTWELGNGMSFNVFGGERRVKSYANLSADNWSAGGNPNTSIRGVQMLSPGASLYVRQAWGDFSIAGNVVPISTVYYTNAAAPGYVPSAACNAQPGTTFCNYTDDAWGWSTAASTKILTPWVTPGDYFIVQGTYAQGALNYATGNNQASPGLFGSGNTIAIGAITDATYVNGAGYERTTGWAVAAGYMHWWTPTFKQSVTVTHTEISYNDTVKSNRWFCGGGGARTLNVNLTAAENAAGVSCDPGYKYETAATTLSWYPVGQRFRLAVEALYTHISTAYEGQTLVIGNQQGYRPSGLYLAKNQGIWSGVFRANLAFPGQDD